MIRANPDERMRELERRAQLGDREAAEKLAAMRQRSGFDHPRDELIEGLTHRNTEWAGYVRAAFALAESGAAPPGGILVRDFVPRRRDLNIASLQSFLGRFSRYVTLIYYKRPADEHDRALVIAYLDASYAERGDPWQGVWVAEWPDSESEFRRWVSRPSFYGDMLITIGPNWEVYARQGNMIGPRGRGLGGQPGWPGRQSWWPRDFYPTPWPDYGYHQARPRTNPGEDERQRKLERQAKLGDAEARERLMAARSRAGQIIQPLIERPARPVEEIVWDGRVYPGRIARWLTTGDPVAPMAEHNVKVAIAPMGSAWIVRASRWAAAIEPESDRSVAYTWLILDRPWPPGETWWADPEIQREVLLLIRGMAHQLVNHSNRYDGTGIKIGRELLRVYGHANPPRGDESFRRAEREGDFERARREMARRFMIEPVEWHSDPLLEGLLQHGAFELPGGVRALVLFGPAYPTGYRWAVELTDQRTQQRLEVPWHWWVPSVPPAPAWTDSRLQEVLRGARPAS